MFHQPARSLPSVRWMDLCTAERCAGLPPADPRTSLSHNTHLFFLQPRFKESPCPSSSVWGRQHRRGQSEQGHREDVRVGTAGHWPLPAVGLHLRTLHLTPLPQGTLVALLGLSRGFLLTLAKSAQVLCLSRPPVYTCPICSDPDCLWLVEPLSLEHKSPHSRLTASLCCLLSPGRRTAAGMVRCTEAKG